MEVSLPPQLEDFVRAQVRSGRYADEEEVVRDALRQMRALVKAAEDPTVAGLVRDAMGIANQAQRDVAHVLQIADRETSVLGEVVGPRRVARERGGRRRAQGARRARARPGRARADRAARPRPPSGARCRRKAMRQNLEATAKALGVLTAVLERVNSASRTVNSVIAARTVTAAWRAR